MGQDITVQVVDDDEQPVEGVKVDVEVDGSMFESGVGGYLETDYTDDEGQAHFTTACDYPDWAEIKIFVDDTKVAEETIGGGSYTVHKP